MEFKLQKGPLMSALGMWMSSSLRKSSVFWVLFDSFGGCSLAVFVMLITDYIIWWISPQNFSILKREILKMSSQAGSSSRGDTTRIPGGAPDRDWSKLPLDALGTIITMLGTLTDSCRFGAVCRSWYQAELESRPSRRTVKNNQSPMLIVPVFGDWFKKYRRIHLETAVDIDEDRRSCGSSHGWLITMDVKSTWFTLVNPCSRILIDVAMTMKDAMNLNNANDIENFFIIKAVLSVDPWFHADEWGMMVIFGEMCRMALYVSHTKSWTFFDPQFKDFHDVIFYMGKFYLVDAYSLVYSCDINDLTVVQVVGPPVAEPQFLFRNYLVESHEGDLLQVWRWLIDDNEGSSRHYETKGFQVFKLKQEGEGGPIWEELQKLEGMALYLGDNHGISVKTSDYPGKRADRIHFTMECSDMSKTGWRDPCMRCDVGRYALKRKRIKRRDDSDEDERRRPHPPSIWVIPTLRGNGPDFKYDFADR